MRRPRRPLRWYREQPLATRLHVGIRWMMCPFAEVEAELPARGSILDWGCGHGVLTLWASHRSAGRTIHGVDIDDDKVVIARAVAETAAVGDRTSFATVSPTDLPVGSWDAVVINDVLYLLSPEQQVALVAAAAAAVAPGGRLVIKAMGDKPRWKVRATEAQETLAVDVLGITDSDAGVHRSPPIDEVLGWMAAAGLAASARRVDRGYHCPHVLVVGRRPG